MSHTTKKWYVGYEQEYDIDAGDDGRTIGYPTVESEFDGTVFMVDGEDQVETVAEQIRDEKTAHLIAAAPEMLAILEELRESSTCCGTYDLLDETTWASPDLVDRIESAIKKARGEE